MNIHESAEDYLEAVLKLWENGYIQMDGDGYITFLPPGEREGKSRFLLLIMPVIAE